jgi:hypothetical protein
VVATLFDISNSGWSAIAAWVGLLLVAVAALVAYFQLRNARQLRAEQAQPYVVIYMESTEADEHAVDLVVKNSGATAAKDIHLTIDPAPQMSASDPVEEIKVPSVIRTLVPGQEWRTFWDTALHRDERGLPRHHTATIEFSDSRGHLLGPYRFDLDWDQVFDRGYIVTHRMHDLAKAAQDIHTVLLGWRQQNALRVLAYDGDEHDRRQREYYEKRQREQQGSRRRSAVTRARRAVSRLLKTGTGAS